MRNYFLLCLFIYKDDLGECSSEQVGIHEPKVPDWLEVAYIVDWLEVVDVVIVEMVDIGVLEKVIRVNTVGGY
jgi:hypothetical protein